MTSDIQHALKTATQQLSPISDSPRLDAEILLSFVLKKNRTYLYAHGDALLSEQQQQDFQRLLSQRHKGMPIAYLTQTREFWSHVFTVNEHTLIPRPETELLVELVLQHLQQDEAHVLELGTGSGVIALTLASEKSHWTISAADKHPLTLAIAKQNAEAMHLQQQVSFYISDWFQAFSLQRFHAIVSNPPYIQANDPHLQQQDVRFEPREALISGEDGLDALRHIIAQSQHHLLPGGFLFLEHGYNQKKAVARLMQQHGFPNPKTFRDYQGNDRVTCGRLGIPFSISYT